MDEDQINRIAVLQRLKDQYEKEVVENPTKISKKQKDILLSMDLMLKSIDMSELPAELLKKAEDIKKFLDA